MQDRGPIGTTKVAHTARDMPHTGPASDDEEDHNEDDSESQSDPDIPAEALEPVQKKGKGKATARAVTGQGKKTTKPPWGLPPSTNVDFNLDIPELIKSLEPGQLLTPDEVYSAPEWHGLPQNHPRRDVSLRIKMSHIHYFNTSASSPHVSNADSKGGLVSRGPNGSAFRAMPVEPMSPARANLVHILLVPHLQT
jgi:hypothetical protein